MIKINEESKEYFQQVCRFARDSGKMVSFRKYINYLNEYAGKDNTECHLYRDSYMSFDFRMMQVRDYNKNGVVFAEPKYWFNGGLIYHGAIDGFGSGSGPSFAVTLNPTDGWSVHT